MAATLWKIYDFFVRVPDGRDEKPDSAKNIDVRVPCGRDEKPYSEKSVDLRVPSGRDSQKSVDLRVAYGRGEKPDSEERFMSNPFLPLKYKLKAVKVYTRHVGQEVFWDKKLGRHRTFKELQKDPEIRREIKEYIICRGLEQFGMNLEKLLGFVNDKELNFRINAESCWDSMELEHPATLEELGMDPENKGIISDFLRFFAVKHLLNEIDALFLGHNNERIFVFTINHRDQHVAASLHPVGMDIYIHTSLLQPIALPDGGNRTLNNSLLVSNSEKENTREAVKLTLTGLLEIIDGLVSCCWDQQIIVLTTNHNQRDPFHTALLHPLNINAYMHTSSPQPLALPDGGEIVELDSLEQKLLANFDATNEKAYQSGVLVFHSEKKNTREASKGQCMKESALSLVDSTTRISSMHFNAPDYKGDLVRAYQGDPFTFNSEKKGTTEGECLTNSVLSDDDSTKQNSLPDCTSLASFPETIEDFDDFDDGAGMLPNLKDEVSYSFLSTVFFSANPPLVN
ncbi:hypothetical protein Vadar_024770 [Vaccinium darrowii]|uniref:Uncharacterized protein n=1 Tax=Vaccinium darrowii TaxID=229202 RepID=A0ACB7YGB9_9ERIC|nr:hypothetical protein Vadar_024770 [Vaccinium darrowii]